MAILRGGGIGRVREGSNIETDTEPGLSLLLTKRSTVLLSLTVTFPVSSSRNSSEDGRSPGRGSGSPWPSCHGPRH